MEVSYVGVFGMLGLFAFLALVRLVERMYSKYHLDQAFDMLPGRHRSPKPGAHWAFWDGPAKLLVHREDTLVTITSPISGMLDVPWELPLWQLSREDRESLREKPEFAWFFRPRVRLALRECFSGVLSASKEGLTLKMGLVYAKGNRMYIPRSRVENGIALVGTLAKEMMAYLETPEEDAWLDCLAREADNQMRLRLFRTMIRHQKQPLSPLFFQEIQQRLHKVAGDAFLHEVQRIANAEAQRNAVIQESVEDGMESSLTKPVR